MAIHPTIDGPPQWLPLRPWNVTTSCQGKQVTYLLVNTTAALAIAAALDLGGSNCALVQCLREGEWT